MYYRITSHIKDPSLSVQFNNCSLPYTDDNARFFPAKHTLFTKHSVISEFIPLLHHLKCICVWILLLAPHWEVCIVITRSLLRIYVNLFDRSHDNFLLPARHVNTYNVDIKIVFSCSIHSSIIFMWMYCRCVISRILDKNIVWKDWYFFYLNCII